MQHVMEDNVSYKRLSILLTFAASLSFLLLLKTCKMPSEEDDKAPFKFKKDFSVVLSTSESEGLDSNNLSQLHSRDAGTGSSEKLIPTFAEFLHAYVFPLFPLHADRGSFIQPGSEAGKTRKTNLAHNAHHNSHHYSGPAQFNNAYYSSIGPNNGTQNVSLIQGAPSDGHSPFIMRAAADVYPNGDFRHQPPVDPVISFSPNHFSGQMNDGQAGPGPLANPGLNLPNPFVRRGPANVQLGLVPIGNNGQLNVGPAGPGPLANPGLNLPNPSVRRGPANVQLGLIPVGNNGQLNVEPAGPGPLANPGLNLPNPFICGTPLHITPGPQPLQAQIYAPRTAHGVLISDTFNRTPIGNSGGTRNPLTLGTTPTGRHGQASEPPKGPGPLTYPHLNLPRPIPTPSPQPLFAQAYTPLTGNGVLSSDPFDQTLIEGSKTNPLALRSNPFGLHGQASELPTEEKLLPNPRVNPTLETVQTLTPTFSDVPGPTRTEGSSNITVPIVVRATAATTPEPQLLYTDASTVSVPMEQHGIILDDQDTHRISHDVGRTIKFNVSGNLETRPAPVGLQGLYSDVPVDQTLIEGSNRLVIPLATLRLKPFGLYGETSDSEGYNLIPNSSGLPLLIFDIRRNANLRPGIFGHQGEFTDATDRPQLLSQAPLNLDILSTTTRSSQPREFTAPETLVAQTVPSLIEFLSPFASKAAPITLQSFVLSKSAITGLLSSLDDSSSLYDAAKKIADALNRLLTTKGFLPEGNLVLSTPLLRATASSTSDENLIRLNLLGAADKVAEALKNLLSLSSTSANNDVEIQEGPSYTGIINDQELETYKFLPFAKDVIDALAYILKPVKRAASERLNPNEEAIEHMPISTTSLFVGNAITPKTLRSISGSKLSPHLKKELLEAARNVGHALEALQKAAQDATNPDQLESEADLIQKSLAHLSQKAKQIEQESPRDIVILRSFVQNVKKDARKSFMGSLRKTPQVDEKPKFPKSAQFSASTIKGEIEENKKPTVGALRNLFTMFSQEEGPASELQDSIHELSRLTSANPSPNASLRLSPEEAENLLESVSHESTKGKETMPVTGPQPFGELNIEALASSIVSHMTILLPNEYHGSLRRKPNSDKTTEVEKRKYKTLPLMRTGRSLKGAIPSFEELRPMGKVY